MSLLDSVQTSNDAKGETDTLGGGSFLLDSGIYPTKIEQAFLTKSTGGALAMNLRVKVKKADGSLGEHREVIYFTNRNGETEYSRDGVKHQLPGYITVNAVCKLATGKTLKELGTSQGVVPVWNSQARKEVATTVELVNGLGGAELYLGIQRIKENKTEKGGDGKYHPINQPKELNSIDKVFRVADKMTLPEVISGATEPQHFNAWVERFSGQVVDRFKADAPAQAPGAASPMAGAATTPAQATTQTAAAPAGGSGLFG